MPSVSPGLLEGHCSTERTETKSFEDGEEEDSAATDVPLVQSAGQMG